LADDLISGSFMACASRRVFAYTNLNVCPARPIHDHRTVENSPNHSKRGNHNANIINHIHESRTIWLPLLGGPDKSGGGHSLAAIASFGGLPLLRQFKVLARRGNGVRAVMLTDASSLVLPFMPPRHDLHAERHLAKAGGSNCKPRGIPTLATRATAEVERAERSGGLHKQSAEDWGEACGRGRGWPTSGPCCCRCSYGRGVAARVDRGRPAEILSKESSSFLFRVSRGHFSLATSEKHSVGLSVCKQV
jgi:hypothetical protein